MIMLHNYMILEIYFNQFMALSDAKKRKLGNLYGPVYLFLETYNYVSGLEMKNQLIQEGKVIKKNLQIYLTCPDRK